MAGLPQQEENMAALTAMEQDKLETAFKNNVNWFVWIGAMSLINTILNLAGANLMFIIGLGYSQLLDGVMLLSGGGLSNPLNYLWLTLDVGVSASFIFLALASQKGNRGTLLIGILVYVFDAVLLFSLQDFASGGMHLFALIFLGSAWLQGKEIDRRKKAAAHPDSPEAQVQLEPETDPVSQPSQMRPW